MTTNAPAHDTVLAAELLDPGIADVVIMLRNLGFNPTDSGDGVSKPDEQRDFDVKHVACAFDPMNSVPSLAGPARFFDEAERLQQVLGSGWRVQATFDPAHQSYIMLATKNEPPGPRHSDAGEAWSAAASEQSVRRGNAESRAEMLYRAGAQLWVALQHELGRR